MAKKLYYKIGEACKQLEIQPYVLRYWETEFPFLNPSKSRSGQRVYGRPELDVIRRIKDLLYEEGYTIAGAKKKLEAELAEAESGAAAKAVAEPAADAGAAAAKAPVPRSEPAAKAKSKAKGSKAGGTKARGSKAKGTAAKKVRAAAGSATLPLAAAADDEDAAELGRLRDGVSEALRQARELLAVLPPAP